MMEGYRENNVRLWRLKLEDAPKEEDKYHLCINNESNDQNINAVLPESNIKEMLEFLYQSAIYPSQVHPVKSGEEWKL